MNNFLRLETWPAQIGPVTCPVIKSFDRTKCKNWPDNVRWPALICRPALHSTNNKISRRLWRFHRQAVEISQTGCGDFTDRLWRERVVWHLTPWRILRGGAHRPWDRSASPVGIFAPHQSPEKSCTFPWESFSDRSKWTFHFLVAQRVLYIYTS